MSLWQTTYSFIEQASRLDSPDELSSLLFECCKRFGFKTLTIGALTRPEIYGSQQPALFNAMPSRWMEHYNRSNYIKSDPILTALVKHSQPFKWRDVTLDNKVQQTIFAEAKEAGMYDGVAVPIHGANQDIFGISLSCDDPEVVDAAPLDQLRVLAVYYQSSLLRMMEVKPPQQVILPDLSPREIDCLSYCALGKTSWEIGQILGITEKTVGFHLNNASVKLNASNRIFAVVKALKLGLINP